MNPIEQKIQEANDKVMGIMTGGRPQWVDVAPAGTVVPEMQKNWIFVAGPPIENAERVHPVKVAISGAIVHDKLARDMDEAWQKVLSGEIIVKSGQDYSVACGAAMAVSASMPLMVVKDAVYGGLGFCAPHPGPSMQVLRWGFYDEQVEKDLCWFRDHYCPALGATVRAAGGVDLHTLLAKTGGMGDENHNRQPAASMAMALQLLPFMLDLEFEHKIEIVKEFTGNDRFFLHVMMAGVESVVASCKNTPFSTVMVGMGGNGTTFGLQFAGTGNDWFTTEAPLILGRFLSPTYTVDDIVGFLGDSCVTEVYGLGGMSALAGPSYVRLTGGNFQEAKRRTEAARAVSLGEHVFAPIPWDDFRGFPVGVDMRKVVGLSIVPTSHGGSTLKIGGQGGAGFAEFPMACFKKGLAAFAQRIKEA